MNAIITGILVGVGTTVMTSFVYAVVRRITVRTKNDEAIERIEEKMEEIGEGQRVIFKMMLPLLLAVKGGKPNGELTEALHLYNSYMQQK